MKPFGIIALAAACLAVGLRCGSRFPIRQGGDVAFTPQPLAATLPSLAVNPSTPPTDNRSWVDLKQEFYDANDAADAKLNEIYKNLSAGLGPDERKKLVDAERAWIIFRDAECIFQSEYAGFGNDRHINYTTTATALTQERIAQLRSAFEIHGIPLPPNP